MAFVRRIEERNSVDVQLPDWVLKGAEQPLEPGRHTLEFDGSRVDVDVLQHRIEVIFQRGLSGSRGSVRIPCLDHSDDDAFDMARYQNLESIGLRDFTHGDVVLSLGDDDERLAVVYRNEFSHEVE